MNTLQKTKLRGTGINCGLIVLLFAVVLLLSQVLPQNTYRRVLVPIIWQMCIFILLGTSLNLTLGYLGQLTLGHMGFAGVGAYTAALTSLVTLALSWSNYFKMMFRNDPVIAEDIRNLALALEFGGKYHIALGKKMIAVLLLTDCVLSALYRTPITY